MKEKNERLERVRRTVKSEATHWTWNYHLTPVLEHALVLARELGADAEIVELGVLLHDIGRIREPEASRHELIGVEHAREILSEAGYDQDTIERVLQIVRSHRGKYDPKPETLEAKIVASADAMSHFDAFLAVFGRALEKFGYELEPAIEWIDKKTQRSWAKICLPEARERIRPQYEASRLLIESMKKYLEGSGRP